jgi:hypothetical protein
MSAAERNPFQARCERAAEVEGLIADTSARLDVVKAEIATAERDLRRILHGRSGAGLWHVLAGVLSLPLIAMAGLLACALLAKLAGR